MCSGEKFEGYMRQSWVQHDNEPKRTSELVSDWTKQRLINIQF